jgi:hypothetical protein
MSTGWDVETFLSRWDEVVAERAAFAPGRIETFGLAAWFDGARLFRRWEDVDSEAAGPPETFDTWADDVVVR